nr:Thioredoxin-like fold protein [Ipomoea batatas]GMD31783.1 Thioredoxin-like fold protein [Ipomoea batatas]GMD34925.1 Thioredoxin-like fold protein [Ipomoea batatas]
MAWRENEFHKNPKMKSGSYFNRSMTVYHGRTTSPDAFGFGKKPPVERMGSIKHLNTFESMVSVAGNSFSGKVKKLCSIFDSQKFARGLWQSLSPTSKSSVSESGDSLLRLPGTEDRVVVYFTSLRGIRRTFEDCYTARMILKGFRVDVDERDVSMDNAYKMELQSVLGQKSVPLPQIFIKGKHIGGAEVIKQLNEVGELPKLLRGLPTRPPGYVCEGCGDVRFVPCTHCDGSRKFFDEDDGQVRRCPVCNENGLIRCDYCCD